MSPGTHKRALRSALACGLLLLGVLAARFAGAQSGTARTASPVDGGAREAPASDYDAAVASPADAGVGASSDGALAASTAASDGGSPASATSAAVTADAAPASAPDLTTLPMGRGLPVVVRVGLFYLDVSAVDENEGAFAGTVDIRLRWSDSRLAYPPAEAPAGYVELRGAAADARLGQIWSPEVHIANEQGEGARTTRGLRIYPDGRVEVMQRTRGRFATAIDAERFPFDQQRLRVELLSERDPADHVALDFHQDDLTFSHASPRLQISGWNTGLVTLEREPLEGWHGETHSRVVASLEIARIAGRTAPAIFIPLFASLLIPLLAMWLNRSKNGEFSIEAFELANVVIGGVFAVIALNFSVNAEYRMLAVGDNTVTRLFGLNYVTLAVSLIINVALFRFNAVKRIFGGWVQEEVYRYFTWAVPLLALSTAAAILLAGAA